MRYNGFGTFEFVNEEDAVRFRDNFRMKGRAAFTFRPVGACRF
jgi:hypothetical protein